MKFLRYRDLVRMGIVTNRMTLSRWIDFYGFPAGILLGPNTRAYPEKAVEKWLAERPRSKCQAESKTNKRRGKKTEIR